VEFDVPVWGFPMKQRKHSGSRLKEDFAYQWTAHNCE